MSKNIPSAFLAFQEDQPAIHAAYESLGQAISEAGPLDAKSRALAKIGICTGAKLESALRSHVRRALEVGCTAEEIRHIIFLSTTTIGFPSMMAALTWANLELGQE